MKSVDTKVTSLQVKVDYFKVFKKETDLPIEGIEDSMNFANAERESFKKSLQGMQSQLDQLKDKKTLYGGISAAQKFAFLWNKTSCLSTGRHEGSFG